MQVCSPSPWRVVGQAHACEWRDTYSARWCIAAFVNMLHNSRNARSEEHTSELQSRGHLVCRLLLEKKKYRLHFHALHFTRTPPTGSVDPNFVRIFVGLRLVQLMAVFVSIRCTLCGLFLFFFL